MKPKAYSYLRFSTPEQAKGDSFRRQVALAEDYAARHGLELDRDLTFEDLGVSAYRGRNAETGRLADFRRAVDEGYVAPGSYLLVESLDRISRQAARKALNILGDIADEGITVVTLNDGKAYTKQSLDNDPTSLILALLTFIRANEESVIKGQRVKAAWNAKRDKAKEKPLTRRVPAWIAHDQETNTLHLIPERAAIVARIFSMLADGIGKHRIAETFNREGVPTFGDNGTSRKAAMWHRSYIDKIAKNPAAMGTLIPHVVEFDENGKKRRKALDPIPDYYPAAVDADTFNRVQAQGMAGRAPKEQNGEAIKSLLAGLAKCPSCGSSMTRVQKGPKKGGKPRLVCTKAKGAAGCERVRVPQEAVEQALIENIDFIAGTMPSGNETIDLELERANATLGGIEDQISNLIDAIAQNPAPSLLERLNTLEAEKQRAEEEVNRLARQASTMAADVVQRRMAELRTVLAAEPIDVGKANALLRQSLNAVTVDYNTGMLRFAWKQGGETSLFYGWPHAE